MLARKMGSMITQGQNNACKTCDDWVPRELPYRSTLPRLRQAAQSCFRCRPVTYGVDKYEQFWKQGFPIPNCRDVWEEEEITVRIAISRTDRIWINLWRRGKVEKGRNELDLRLYSHPGMKPYFAESTFCTLTCHRQPQSITISLTIGRHTNRLCIVGLLRYYTRLDRSLCN